MVDKSTTGPNLTRAEREAYDEGREARWRGRSINVADGYSPQYLAVAFRSGWIDEENQR